MITTADTDRVQRALETLQGRNLFYDNAFGVTGLPFDASNRQVRRARDESRSAFYEPPAGYPHAPIPPSEEADHRTEAFEHLQDPLTRLIHELFWVDEDPSSTRSRAVADLSAALEATAPDDDPIDAATRTLWSDSLSAWSQLLGDRATWDDTFNRVDRINDRRLTRSMVAHLREQLPHHFVRCIANTAASLARVRPYNGRRVASALRVAGKVSAGSFDSAQVDEALRAAVSEEIAAVEAARDAAIDAGAARGVEAAARLLRVTAKPLTTIDAILSKDPVADGCHDSVARGVNNCVVGQSNHTNQAVDVSSLEAAQAHVRTAEVDQLIAGNLQALRYQAGQRSRSIKWTGGRVIAALLAVVALTGGASALFGMVAGIYAAAITLSVLVGLWLS